MAIAACTDSTALSPTVSSSGKAAHNYSQTLDSTNLALAVSIGGYPHVEGEGTYFYWANVHGGTPPYSYAWFYSYCTNDTNECSDQMPLMNADGDTVPVEIPYWVGKIHLLVNAWDSNDRPFSGGAEYKVVNFGNPDGTGGSGFKCDIGPNLYPIHEIITHDSIIHYRRNGCTGAREDSTG